eukprot:COSAG03_NODE_93_length_13213_cov_77.901022_5_plen_131_part_00
MRIAVRLILKFLAVYVNDGRSRYLKSHVRTSKTLTSNSDAEEFDEYEERAVAQSDWAEDCERYKLKLTESLDKTTYFSSMYQLVELWSEDCHLSYATFLTWVLENIASWSEQQVRRTNTCCLLSQFTVQT